MDLREDKNGIKRFLAIVSESCSSLTLLDLQCAIMRRKSCPAQNKKKKKKQSL